MTAGSRSRVSSPARLRQLLPARSTSGPTRNLLHHINNPRRVGGLLRAPATTTRNRKRADDEERKPKWRKKERRQRKKLPTSFRPPRRQRLLSERRIAGRARPPRQRNPAGQIYHYPRPPTAARPVCRMRRPSPGPPPAAKTAGMSFRLARCFTPPRPPSARARSLRANFRRPPVSSGETSKRVTEENRGSGRVPAAICSRLSTRVSPCFSVN